MSHFDTSDVHPAPTSGAAAAGSTHLETLARFSDSRLDRLDGLWPARLARATRQISRVATQTNNAANVDNWINFDTVTMSTTGAFETATVGNIIPTALYEGWYHINLQVRSQPSGTADQGSYRRATLRVFESTGIVGQPLIEEFLIQDQERGPTGPTSEVGLDTVVYLSPARRIYAYFAHGNTSSTVNIIAPTTLTVTLIAPKGAG